MTSPTAKTTPDIHSRDTRLFREVVKLREVSESEAPWLSHLDLNSRLGGWYWDIKNKNLAATRKVFDLFDIDPPGVSQKNVRWLDAVHPAHRRGLARKFQRFILQHGKIDAIFRVGRDIENRWIQLLGTAQYDDVGAPVVATGLVMDVTYHRTLLNETVSEVAKRQQRISYDLTEELAQQLSGILIRTETLMNKLDGENDAARSRLTKVIQCVRDAQLFTRDLSNTAVPVLVSGDELERKIEILVRMACDRFEKSCTFSSSCEHPIDLGEFESTQVYRMAENGISLLESYAKDSVVHVRLRINEISFLEFSITGDIDIKEIKASAEFEELRRRAKLLNGAVRAEGGNPAKIRCMI